MCQCFNVLNEECQVQPHMRRVQRGGGTGEPFSQILSHWSQGDLALTFYLTYCKFKSKFELKLRCYSTLNEMHFFRLEQFLQIFAFQFQYC